MRRVIIGLVVATVCAFPAASFAQVPRQDSVSLSVDPGQSGATVSSDPCCLSFKLWAITATSGPSGENPSGRVSISIPAGVRGGYLLVEGPVTCLAVNGNTATLNFDDQLIQPFPIGIVTVQVTDNQRDTFVAFPTERAPTDCSPFTLLPEEPVSGGDISVIDAPRFPTSKEQCINGGWQSFNVFKNQGDCVSFVATGGKNPPS